MSVTALRDDFETIIAYLLIGTHNSVSKRVELRLITAMAVAGKANQAKSDFFSRMSHEPVLNDELSRSDSNLGA